MYQCTFLHTFYNTFWQSWPEHEFPCREVEYLRVDDRLVAPVGPAHDHGHAGLALVDEVRDAVVAVPEKGNRSCRDGLA